MIKILSENKRIIDITGRCDQHFRDIIAMETTIKIRHNLLAINHDLETQTAQFYKVHVLNITGYGRMHLEHNLITI